MNLTSSIFYMQPNVMIVSLNTQKVTIIFTLLFCTCFHKKRKQFKHCTINKSKKIEPYVL